MVIVNLQKTPKDSHAGLIIRYYVDDVIRLVMEQLEIKIPEAKKLSLDELKSNFCRTRPEDWVKKQLEMGEEENDESSESEASEEISVELSDNDPEWEPGIKRHRTKSNQITPKSKKPKFN